jgi:NADH:ubiquinone oxidoreductase subunit B-like Fe-S oxidoreductase
VNLFIPGCPPRPEAIIYGILKLVGGAPANSTPETEVKQDG